VTHPGRKRVLIVNAYFDELRRGARPFSVPTAMGPVQLAGALDPDRCEIRLYNEQHSGPLNDPALLGWPDLLVLTGLTSSFDRMLQLTAYARSQNLDVVVAAGGPAIRALPKLAASYFDYVCTGDVESLADVASDAFGPSYAADVWHPRYDLATDLGRIGYVESSRYCNFHCSFCSLTAESRRYKPYSLDQVRYQLEAVGKRHTLIFIDNNFYGNDRGFFVERVKLLEDLVRGGRIRGWSALVTNDFFLDDENLRLVKRAGCQALFSGVESFDTAEVRRFRKLQNTRLPQVELIRKCLDAGLTFFYGLIFDASHRHVADMRHELELVMSMPEITLPTFATLTIPLPGTPYFRQCVDAELFLPNAKLRDLDGSTLVLRPLDPIVEVTRFLRELLRMSGWRSRAFRHASGVWWRYRRTLNRDQMLGAVARDLQLLMPSIFLASGRARRQDVAGRTFVTTTETLDPQYTPAFRVARKYESHFKPTMLTDNAGALSEAVAADLSIPRAQVNAIISPALHV
jgi:hypothetical protein